MRRRRPRRRVRRGRPPHRRHLRRRGLRRDASPPAAPASYLHRGAPCSTPHGSRPQRSRRSSAACRRASSTPPTSPPTPSTGRSRTRPRATSPLPYPTRTASSSASAAASTARWRRTCAPQQGHEVVAVTLKLWADQEGDGERSCCSPQAVLGARALAHGARPPAPHARPRGPLPGSGGGRLPRRARRGPHAEPLRALQRPRALRRDAGARRPARRERARHGPLRAHRRRRRGAAARARGRPATRTRPTCSPALRPELLRRLRFPLGDLTKPAGARDRARRAACPVAEKRESQDLCFLAGTSRERFLARHARRARHARATWSTPAAACSAATAASTASRSASARASASPRESRYMWCRRTRAPTASWSGPAARLATHTVPLTGTVLHRDDTPRRPGEAALPLRAGAVPASVGRGDAPRSCSTSPPRRRPGPDRLPHGRRPRRRSRHHRRASAHKLGAHAAPLVRRDPRQRSSPSSRSAITCACRRRR